jgi:hypothetical protein
VEDRSCARVWVFHDDFPLLIIANELIDWNTRNFADYLCCATFSFTHIRKEYRVRTLREWIEYIRLAGGIAAPVIFDVPSAVATFHNHDVTGIACRHWAAVMPNKATLSRLDRVRMDAVVDLGQRVLEVPFLRHGARLFVLEALEFLDQVQLEFGTEPGTELERDVAVRIGVAATAGLGEEADGAGGSGDW